MFISLALFLSMSCCVIVPPQDDPPPSRPTPTPVTIAAAQVFSTSMIGQTWTFQNAYGDHTFITIESAPFCVYGFCDGKSVTWHFTKDAPRAYWNPGIPSELGFYLHLEADGSWRSIGFEMVQNGVSQSVFITPLAGWTGVPYTIIPVSSTAPAVNTAYQGNLENGLTVNTTPSPVSTWNSTWTTYAGIKQTTTPLTGTVNALISQQCEGGTSGACDGIKESWHFCPGVGLCEIEPVVGLDANGAFISLDPNLVLLRTQ